MYHKIINKNTIRQIIRFLIAGFIALFVDIGIYVLLQDDIGIFYAKATSFITATIVTFFINKFWTFQKSSFNFFELIQFILFYIASAYLNALINKNAFLILNDRIIAFVIANGICTNTNFLGLKLIIFGKINSKSFL
jgi:putative flippase GtrA